MDEKGFRSYLENEKLTDKAITSRLTRARRVEKEFDVSIEEIVSSKKKMFEIREKIYAKFGNMGSTPGNLYNAICKYYKFRNGVEMDRIK